MRQFTLLALAACAAALFHTDRAAACGGTFCAAPTPAAPAPMPVDQTGENILFVVKNGRVEAHIQIQYSGDPRFFGWVIPVPKAPDFRVGSQALFDALLASTVPSFDRNAPPITDQCGTSSSSSSSDSSGCGSGGSDEATAASGSFGPAGAAGGSQKNPTDPTVEKERVGAFEVAVLTGGTVDGVTKWLTDNALQVDPKANGVLQEYLDKGHVFVAVKLASGVGLDEIHPIVVEYEGVEPCIPIKLTAIAAKEDMVIRAFFLGEGRWVSDNYKHVVPNEARFDWVNLGSNYNQVIARAVDAEMAGGHAFVTEFVGRTTAAVTAAQRQQILGPQWSSAPFYTAKATSVVNLLNAQGLTKCVSASSCTSTHALVFPLLEKWLPVPAGQSAGAYYSSLPSKAQNAMFDAPGFAKDLETQVIEPAKHALALLDGSITLTRMLTAMSPSEMTLDPTFVERTDLPDVSRAHSAAVHTTCDGKAGLLLPDGVEVYNPSSAGQPWPNLSTSSYAQRVEQFGPTGDAALLRDSRADNQAAITAHNAAASWPPAPKLDVADDTSSCATTSSRAVRPFAFAMLGAALSLFARRLLRQRRRAL